MLACFNYIIFLLLLANSHFCQIYQHFIFKDNQPFIYDTIPQKIAQRALDNYYKNELNKAVLIYDSLLKIKPSYYQAYYNQAKCFALIGNYSSAIFALKNYVLLSKEQCKYSIIKNTECFIPIINEIDGDSIIRTCSNFYNNYVEKEKILNPKLLSLIQVIEATEQEILGSYMDNERNNKLKKNFIFFTKNIDTTNFPNKREIGFGTSLIELIILHCDYYPEIQFRLGTRLMQQHKKGYNTKMCAYIIDRGLRNMKRPQLYGTILLKDNTGQTKLDEYDNLQKLIKRRKKIGLQDYEDFLINRNITK